MMSIASCLGSVSRNLWYKHMLLMSRMGAGVPGFHAESFENMLKDASKIMYYYKSLMNFLLCFSLSELGMFHLATKARYAACLVVMSSNAHQYLHKKQLK
jgi:hypothetical protein